MGLFTKKSNANFWISYSDLVAGLLFIFLAILLISHLSFSSQKKENEKVSEKLQYFLKLRERIAEELRINFIKEGVEVLINPKNGILIIKENLLFDRDRANLKPEGKELLKKIVPTYTKTLFGSQEFQEWVKNIVIEGHASKERAERYLKDMELSQERAFAVLSFVFGDEFGEFEYMEKFRDITTAQGRGFMASVEKLPDENVVDLRRRNRRVEIKYMMQSDRMLEDLHTIMEERKYERKIYDKNRF